MVRHPENRLQYLSACWDHAQHHWVAAVLIATGFAYSALTGWGEIVYLPRWARIETWPKLPLSSALVITLAAVLFIAIEGGFRLHRTTVEQAPELMLSYTGSQNDLKTPLVISNLGGGTAELINVFLRRGRKEVHFGDSIPYLQEGGKLEIFPTYITDGDKTTLALSGLTGFFESLQSEWSLDQPWTNQEIKLWYVNKHGVRFERAFSMTHNFASGRTTLTPSSTIDIRKG